MQDPFCQEASSSSPTTSWKLGGIHLSFWKLGESSRRVELPVVYGECVDGHCQMFGVYLKDKNIINTHRLYQLQALSNKFQIDVYFFEVYTHCEAPKLISNKIEIHPFWDFPKLKLTHREEFPSLGGHHLVLISIWWELHFGNSSSW